MVADMNLDFVLAMMVAAPLGGALIATAAGTRRRSSAALTVAATAASLSVLTATYSALSVVTRGATTLAVGDRAVLRFDELAAFVAPVIALVATTVLLYARRNLDGDRHAHRFAAGACLLLVASLVTVAAATLAVLVAGWVAASLATVALCGYRGGVEGRATAWIAGRALAVGDLALVGALAVTVTVAGGDLTLNALDLGADELARTTVMSLGPLSLDAATVVALLLVVPALARAGQAPLPRWLPSTVAAPTPVSALLHAGAVNAGAVLLVRTSPIAAQAWGVMVLLAACALANVAMAVAALKARPDRKGQLAESTGAQMAFMLLACAVGAPAVALTHLAGHALYKSARFLGAGDSIRRQARRRRWLVVARRPDWVASVAAGGSVAALWWALSAAAGLPAAEQWLVGAALTAVAAHAVLSVGGGGAPVRSLLAVTGVAVAASAGLALAADRLLGPALVHTGSFADARAALLVLVLVAVGTAMLWRSPKAVAWVVGLPVIAAPRPRLIPTAGPSPTAPRMARVSIAPEPVPAMEVAR